MANKGGARVDNQCSSTSSYANGQSRMGCLFPFVLSIEIRSFFLTDRYFSIDLSKFSYTRCDADTVVIKASNGGFKLNGDKQYSEFCSKISFLYNFIKSNSNKAPTMREIDAYLVKIANENLKSDL